MLCASVQYAGDFNFRGKIEKQRWSHCDQRKAANDGGGGTLLGPMESATSPTDDELPALVDGSSSDEDEPVLVDASPGKPDFSLINVDEVSSAPAAKT